MNEEESVSFSPSGERVGEGGEDWRQALLKLLALARLGSQFPDALKWSALLALLALLDLRGRESRRPVEVARSDVSGLPTMKALAKLHRLQFVAREFFKTHGKQPLRSTQAFSMALAAVDLPPVSHTHVRLVSRGARTSRFLIHHERLDLCAVRFGIVVDQRSGGSIVLGKDDLARCSESFAKKLREACGESALSAHRALAATAGLEVVEVLRGQLGPFVSGLWAAPEDLPVDVRALRSVVRAPADSVLSVQLERLGADVARPSLQDPWMGDEPPEKGKHLARERRLFCTPQLEAGLKALVKATGKAVLVRSS